MAKSIEVTLKLNDRDFIQGIRRANRELDKLQRNLKSSGGGARQLSGQQGLGGLTTAVAAFGAASVATTRGTDALFKSNKFLVNTTRNLAEDFDNVRNSLKGGLVETVEGVKQNKRLYDIQRNLNRVTGELSDEFGNLEAQSRKANGGFAKTGARLFKFLGIATIVAAAVGGIAIAFKSLRESISTAAEFEDIQITLQNITGSAEAGAYALGLVTEEATKLPFAFRDLAGATPVLATISKDLGELRSNINLAADIAANFGIPFDQAASSLQRAFTAGAGAADIFREKGVLAAAGFEAGVSYSIEETRKKILEFGTTIAGAAQTLNTTFTGAVSQAGDRLTLFQGAIGEATSPTFKAFLLELVELFDQNKDRAFELAGQIGQNIVSAFQNAVIGGAYLLDIFEALKNGFIEVVTLGGLLDGFYAKVGQTFKDLGISIGEGLGGIIDFDKAAAARKFFEDVNFTAEEIRASAEKVKEGAKDLDDTTKIILGASDNIGKGTEDTRTALQKFKDDLDKISNISGPEYEAFLGRLKELFNTEEIGIVEYRNMLRELDEAFGQNEGLNNFLDTLGTAQKSLSEDLTEAFTSGKSAMDSFKNFFRTLINQIIADIIRLQIIQPILGAILSPFGYTFGTGGNIVKKVPGMAKGGPVLPGGTYLVGEEGPELLQMGSQGGNIIPNHQLGGMGGTNVTYNINAVDAASFKTLVARDPEFIYNVTRAGSRMVPG